MQKNDPNFLPQKTGEQDIEKNRHNFGAKTLGITTLSMT